MSALSSHQFARHYGDSAGDAWRFPSQPTIPDVGPAIEANNQQARQQQQQGQQQGKPAVIKPAKATATVTASKTKPSGKGAVAAGKVPASKNVGKS